MLAAVKVLNEGIRKKFEEQIRFKPSKHQQIFDSFSSKFPQDAPMFGKPNVLVNAQGFKFGNYVNETLGSYSVENIILMAE